MSQNPTFVQAVADASGRPVEVSPVVEATTRGAGFLAGLATGGFASIEDADRAWTPAARIEPGPPADRDRWRDAVARAGRWYPELSALEFS
jgi:glycerol kinase